MADATLPTILVAGAATTALGPLLGPVSLIIFAAVAGSALAMRRVKMESLWHGAWFILVGVLTALCLAGSIAWALEHYYDVPWHVTLLPTSFLISLGRSVLQPMVEKIGGAAGSIAAGVMKFLAETKWGGR